ncbi:uncharacterized protein LOC131953874 [Physella acuta]|uniref:uncharacterized protein LOC131953874 n=1 Tax=Physella acuta TaxID=109671 RepID=UPI0027DB850C|nr:uncharacterized protein LOC131953874 [Physella acuta]
MHDQSKLSDPEIDPDLIRIFSKEEESNTAPGCSTSDGFDIKELNREVLNSVSRFQNEVKAAFKTNNGSLDDLSSLKTNPDSFHDTELVYTKPISGFPQIDLRNRGHLKHKRNASLDFVVPKQTIKRFQSLPSLNDDYDENIFDDFHSSRYEKVIRNYLESDTCFLNQLRECSNINLRPENANNNDHQEIPIHGVKSLQNTTAFCNVEHASSGVDSIDNHEDSTTLSGTNIDYRPTISQPRRCPIENCEIPDCLLSNRQPEFVPEVKSQLRKKFSILVKTLREKLRRMVIIDDTPVYTNKEVAHPKFTGTEIAYKTYLAGKKNVERHQAIQVSDFLEFFKFDISVVPQTGPINPIETIQKGLGIEKLHLPVGPIDFRPQRPDNEGTHDIPTSNSTKMRKFSWFSRTQKSDGDLPLERKPSSLRNPHHDDTAEPQSSSSAKTKMTYLTGKDAFNYYQLLATIDAKCKVSQLKEERERMLKIYEWKQKTLIEVVKIARDYYSDPREIKLERWKTLKQDLAKEHQSDTDVRVRVSTVPDHWPFFSVFMIMSHITTLGILLLKFGFDKNGMTTRQLTQHDIPTFLGLETITRLEEPNPWMGPPIHFFFAAGAVFAPCVREDNRLSETGTRKEYRALNAKNVNYFGCCEMRSHINIAGTTTLNECMKMSENLGYWTRGVLCSARAHAVKTFAQLIRPCCVGTYGQCEMVSHEHCIFLKGIFHLELDHCVQINCLIDLCRLSIHESNIVPSEDHPWLPSKNSQWQWWRFLTSMPLTYGVIHLLVILPVEVIMMIPLEISAGWHRVLIIFTCSSISGQLMSSIADPDLPHVGSTPGVAGILGVAVLELFQAWNFLRHPVWECIKLVLVIFLYLFLGTLHLFGFFSFVTGFFVGMMGCLMVVPYITYGRRLSRWRFRLVLIGFCLITPTLLTIHSTFRFVQKFYMCMSCPAIECLPYTSVMCKTSTYWD